MIMPDYQTLDNIADAYIPLLLLCLTLVIRSSVRHGKGSATGQTASILSALAIVFGLFTIDILWGVWPHFNLDYSTHTACALVLVAHLIMFQSRARLLLASSFIAYLLLMDYQEYHSWADMLTTGFVISLLYLPLLLRFSRPQLIPV